MLNLRSAGQGLAQQAKASAGAPVIKSALVATSARPKHAAFKPAGRRGLHVAAAQAGAPAPSGERAPRAKKEVTVNLANVKAGDEFEGTVTKVEQFGAFVDFGAEKDGLVHISQLADGFTKSAASVVSAKQVVKVRVLSIDTTTGRIALTMKGGAAAAGEDAEDDAAEDVYDDGEEGEEYEIEDAFEAAPGFEYVMGDYDYPFEMEEDDAALTVEALAEYENAADDEFEHQSDLPVPLNELVTGKVTRVEDYGVFISFSYNGKELSGLLQGEECKVPAAALSADELAEFTVEGELVDEYVDLDVEKPQSYYKVGDTVSAFILEYTEDNKLALTQFADWEIEAQALTAPDTEDTMADLSSRTLSDFDGVSVDPLAEDPLTMAADEGGDDNVDALVAQIESDDSFVVDALAEYRATSAGSSNYTGGLFRVRERNGQLMSPMSFPSRPLRKVNAVALNNIKTTDIDFDGDEIYLEDLWQLPVANIPKDTLKKLGYKIEFDEQGEARLIEREGGAQDADLSMSDHDARVAAFVKDLLDDDEDEAELPARAYRAPCILAASVQSISAGTVKQLRDATGAGMMDCKKALAENGGDFEKATEWLRKKGLAGADKKSGRVAAEGSIATYIHPGSRLGVMVEVNCETDFVAASEKFQSLVREVAMITAASPDVTVVRPDEVPAEVLAKEREVEAGKEDLKSKPEAVRAKIVEGRVEKIKNTLALVNQASLRDPNKTVEEIIKETIAAVGENVQVRRFVKFNLGEGLEKRKNDFAAEVAQQTQAKAEPPKPKAEEPKPKAEEKKPTVQVSASVVKQLRDATGAGMMDCKRALGECNGDMEAANEWLRKKGLAGADKKAGRLAAEGSIVSYIHPGSRLGVLLEVNCETDFVAASEKFQGLASGLAMQIAASPQVQYVSAEDIPPEVFAREKEIEMQRDDLKSKPDAIRAKIAEGRVAKLAQEMALLPQPYLMDGSKTVEQAVKEAVAAIGEKIAVRRFTVFRLGEGIEKKVNDLAADVAAMSGGSK